MDKKTNNNSIRVRAQQHLHQNVNLSGIQMQREVRHIKVLSRTYTYLYGVPHFQMKTGLGKKKE